MNNLVFKGQTDQVLTNSLLIAEKFGKEHRRVMQDIREISCSEEFRAHNFVLSSYTSLQNKDLPMYVMTKDGFTFLVMGYTGELAAKFKEEYIEAFNQMTKELESKKKPLSNLEILVQSAQALLEQEKRMNQIEEKVTLIEARTTTRQEEFTIAGYSTLMKIPMPRMQAAILGKKAKAICQERGIDTGNIYDPRFGTVHTYPMQILKEVFAIYQK